MLRQAFVQDARQRKLCDPQQQGFPWRTSAGYTSACTLQAQRWEGGARNLSNSSILASPIPLWRLQARFYMRISMACAAGRFCSAAWGDVPQQNLKPFQKMHHHYHAAARHQQLAWARGTSRSRGHWCLCSVCNDEHWFTNCSPHLKKRVFLLCSWVGSWTFCACCAVHHALHSCSPGVSSACMCSPLDATRHPAGCFHASPGVPYL